METAARFSEIVIWLLLSIFLLVFASKEKRINLFVKSLFIVCFSTRIVLDLGIQITSQTLKLWQWYDSGISFLIQFLYTFSYFLIFYCISLLIGYSNNKLKPELKTYNGKYRSIWLSYLLFVITGGIYFPFWLYRTVKDLRNNFDEIPYTPGQAVGFLFIPVFNIYWIFKIIITLPLKIKQIEDKYYGSDPRFQFHPVFIILLWFCFIILSNVSQLAIENTDSYFKNIISAILFPATSVVIILLTMQAKINSFAASPTETSS